MALALDTGSAVQGGFGTCDGPAYSGRVSVVFEGMVRGRGLRLVAHAAVTKNYSFFAYDRLDAFSAERRIPSGCMPTPTYGSPNASQLLYRVTHILL